MRTYPEPAQYQVRVEATNCIPPLIRHRRIKDGHPKKSAHPAALGKTVRSLEESRSPPTDHWAVRPLRLTHPTRYKQPDATSFIPPNIRMCGPEIRRIMTDYRFFFGVLNGVPFFACDTTFITETASSNEMGKGFPFLTVSNKASQISDIETFFFGFTGIVFSIQ